MSPSFVNENVHPVRVKKGNTLVRLRPGQVVEADGEYADCLSQVPGVTNATEEHAKVHEAEVSKHRERGEMPGVGRRLGEKLALGPARTALRRAIAAPLRRVVGDDAAPLGPPSGVISSKAEEAAKSDVQRQAFAPGERLPGERVRGAGAPPAFIPASADPSSGEIENAQARAAEEGEALLAELQEGGERVLASQPWAPDPPIEASTTPGSGHDEDDPDDWDDSEDGDELDSEGGDESESPAEPEQPDEQPETPAETPAETPEQTGEVEEPVEPNLTEDGYPDEPYEEHKQDALVAELGRRELPKSGTKAEQITRLRESDAADAAAE